VFNTAPPRGQGYGRLHLVSDQYMFEPTVQRKLSSTDIASPLEGGSGGADPAYFNAFDVKVSD
jgi:hypothetical protein